MLAALLSIASNIWPLKRSETNQKYNLV